MQLKKTVAFVVVTLFFGGLVLVAEADHSWGSFHWKRTLNPFTLTLGDNVSTSWDSYLGTTSSDWSASSVLDTVVKPGLTKPRLCKAVDGRVEVCSEKYGSTGWLGIAQVWVSGSHITKSIVKMNDTYFNTAKYNTPAWRNFVMCQEVGHALGLDHQDENFTNVNLGSCMDYTNSPEANQHPNQHDYDMLEAIYSHFDSSSSFSSGAVTNRAEDAHEGEELADRSEWGREIRRSEDRHESLHVRDLGNGKKVFTFVVWAE